MTEEEIRKIGEDRMKRLQSLLDEGTPLTDKYKELIDLEQQEMVKVIKQNKEEKPAEEKKED